MSDATLSSFTTFGEMLRHLRLRAGLTQDEFGLAVGYSRAHVARLESGQRTPNIGAVQARFIEALQLRDEPGWAAQLVELARHAQADASLEASLPVVPRSLHRSNLPVQLTRFIGHAHDIEALHQLLSQHRLVTLTGAGGVGKTRLAIEVASSIAVVGDMPVSTPAFRDGLWLVQFAPLVDPALVPRTVATTLNLPDLPGQTDTQKLVTQLADQDLLLVLDNCEHLVDACAELAETLLGACPEVRIVVTSREPLRIAGEMLWPVMPLSAPDSKLVLSPQEALEYEAIQLFVEHASALRPDFQLDEQTAKAVAQICHRLDGIPLAIEMAAAEVAALSVEEIASGLDDRFALLTRGRRTALPHHRTLRATLEWSYSLLQEEEKTLLARVSVFVGHWTVQAAKALSTGGENVLPVLPQLVHKSLLVADPQGVETSYHLLESVRQYALERLAASGEANMTRRKHAEYCLSLLNSATPTRPGAESPAWYTHVEQHYGDLRAALTWCDSTEGDPLLGLRLVTSMAGFWRWRRWFAQAPGWLAEGRILLEQALSMAPTAPSALRAGTLNALVKIAVEQRDLRYAKSLAEEALTLYRGLGDKAGIAATLVNLAHGRYAEDFQSTESYLEELLSLSREIGVSEDLAAALTIAGRVWLAQGSTERAIRMLEESLTLWRERGVRWSQAGGIARSLIYLGMAEYLRENGLRAQGLLEESLGLYREAGDKNGIAWCLIYLGHVAIEEGDMAGAATQFREGLKLFREVEVEEILGVVNALAGLSGVEQLRGRLESAAILLSAATGIGEHAAVKLFTPQAVERVLYERAVAASRAKLSDSTYAVAWTEGQRMTQDQAVEYALQSGEGDGPSVR
jgi:predicted ATPase